MGRCSTACPAGACCGVTKAPPLGCGAHVCGAVKLLCSPALLCPGACTICKCAEFAL